MNSDLQSISGWRTVGTAVATPVLLGVVGTEVGCGRGGQATFTNPTRVEREREREREEEQR
jgi:hypothetical protein